MKNKFCKINIHEWASIKIIHVHGEETDIEYLRLCTRCRMEDCISEEEFDYSYDFDIQDKYFHSN